MYREHHRATPTHGDVPVLLRTVLEARTATAGATCSGIEAAWVGETRERVAFLEDKTPREIISHRCIRTPTTASLDASGLKQREARERCVANDEAMCQQNSATTICVRFRAGVHSAAAHRRPPPRASTSVR
ncbi:hypothetical protein MTO96_052143 [Rhipicephalus appendiculatus]